jgi:hypothetical protein
MAAFHAAADIPVPGDHPAVPPQSDVRNFMAMMVEGQRQQLIAQQQQQQLQQQQHSQFLQIMQHFSDNPIGGQVPSDRSQQSFNVGTVPSIKQSLDERYFRRINKFDNKESTWKEWRVHFSAAVREASPELHRLLMKAEAMEEHCTLEMIAKEGPEWVNLAASLFGKLLSFTTGVAFSLVDNAPEEQNGLEAWRLLSRRFNPATAQKCVQLITNLVTMKVTKNDEVLSAMVKWEAMIGTLSRDHKEVFSEKIRTALLVRTLPDKLQDRVHEQLDRLTTYKAVYDKIVSLVQSSTK